MGAIADAVKQFGTATPFSKGHMNAAEKMLVPGETVLYADIVNVSIEPVAGGISPNIATLKGKVNGVFAVTNKRVLFCNNVMGQGTSKQIRLADITSIDNANSVLGSSKVRICGITEMFVIDGNSKSSAALVNAVNNASL